VDGGLALGKLGAVKWDAGESAVAVDSKGGDAWLASHRIALLGGTVWALRRTAPATADVVVIDEGSQVRVPEAAIAVRRIAADGRLLVAGDDRQLPPIVNGAYPEPEEGQPLLHRSIFECLRRADAREAYTTVLLENFRSNATLCRYPAQQVYVPDYRPATADIAARRLDLNAPEETGWAVDVLDPAFPLIVCVLEGVQATAENIVEAGLVADVATSLRKRLRDHNRRPYPDDVQGDTDFWRRGVFVVSPHHAQIRAIRRALAERRTWHARPFVDTVDKMQGQECDAVIVSYGVSDVEYALGEKEFIYSLNRLNVAITRGRSKTIVFLPRPLLGAPVAAFEDDRVAEGIGFMQGLWRWAEHHGESTELQLAPEGRLTIHRVHANGVPRARVGR
jgi:DNA replication ATP-dependent helicase Dna2